MAASNVISRTAHRLLATRSLSIASPNKNSPWTSDKIVKSPFRDIVIPNTTVAEHIWENLERWADKTAIDIKDGDMTRPSGGSKLKEFTIQTKRQHLDRISAMEAKVCGVTNQSYTYHELYKYSRNLSARLRSQLQIRDGDVVCIMMPNSPDYGIVVLGALQAGAEVTTVNPIYTAHEVHRQILLSNPKVVIATQDTIPIVKEALLMAKKKLPIITASNGEVPPDGTISMQEFIKGDNVDLTVLNDVRRTAEDVAFLPYSSGTTGLPKGVELTNRNMVVNCMQQDIEGVKVYKDTTSFNQDATLAVLPFYHIYGLSVILLHKLSAGVKVVTLPKFQPNTYLTALKEHKINLLFAAPPMILFMGNHQDVKKEHLQTIRTINSGAAPVLRKDVERVLEKGQPGMDFLQLYGMTETSPLVTSTCPGSDAYTSAGFGVSNTELRIVDLESNILGPNEVGELLIRGPQVMKGYRNNAEATNATVTEDGWLKTGDLAKIDEDGTVTISNRLKELIKVKGYQVPPAELENILKEHPDVLDVAVVGRPDGRAGEVPKAFIVLKEGRKVDAKEITSFVNERVAEYKRIKEVAFLEALPKNNSGKILRRVLQEEYC